MFVVCLLAPACQLGPAPRTLRIRLDHEKEPLADPLATGAELGLTLWSDQWDSADHPQVEGVEITVSDPEVARVDGSTLVALAPGEVEVHAAGTLEGEPAAGSRRFEVREVDHLEWRLDEKPLPERLVVVAGSDLGLAVVHRDASGQRLLAHHVEIEAPESAEVRYGELPGFTLVKLRPKPGEYAIPGTNHVIEAVSRFDDWSVEGASITLTHGGRPLYVRPPGPTVESLDEDCAVERRPTGTNPFVLQPKTLPDDRTCRVQLTLLGRPITVDATF